MKTYTGTSGRPGRRGFTLVELAAVSATLSAGAMVVMPLGRPAQYPSMKARAADLHREISTQQLMYINDNKGSFTGPNTSGLEWNRDPVEGFANPGVETLAFDTAGGNPTSQGDWLTPLIGDVYGFSPNRAVRMMQKYEVVADPFATESVDFVFAGGNPEDLGQFEQVFEKSGYRQMSYLMMRSFTHFSSEAPESNLVVDLDNDTFYREHFAVQNSNSTALSPEGYTPNIFNVGTQPGNKVMFADGTRFLFNGILDFDPAIFDTPNNNDGSSGPTFDRSRAYGRNASGTDDDGNLALSFRKRGGNGLFVSMFDGSLRTMTREQAWTDPTPWYPSGSVWTGIGATPESIGWVETNLPGGVIH